MEKFKRITIDPAKRSGKPCIRGLRITVYDILSMLADGMSYEEILEDFPKLQIEDIYAAYKEGYIQGRENLLCKRLH